MTVIVVVFLGIALVASLITTHNSEYEQIQRDAENEK
jgi:preprotein translocase subunit SecG